MKRKMDSSNKFYGTAFVLIFATVYIFIFGCYLWGCFYQQIHTFKEWLSDWVDWELDQDWKLLSARGKIRAFFMFILFASLSVVAGATAGAILGTILRFILSLIVF